MQNKSRIVRIIFLLPAICSAVLFCGYVKADEEFTAQDFRIARLLEQIWDLDRIRTALIDKGNKEGEADAEVRAYASNIIKQINEITDYGKIIKLHEDELTNLKKKGLKDGHPTIKVLLEKIETLKKFSE